VDCGGVNAVAVLCWLDGRWVPLLFDGLPELPAAVYVNDDGGLVTGAAAWQLAAESPQRLVQAPMWRLGEGRVDLDGDTGSDGVDVVDLVVAVLRRVHDEAVRAAQQPVTDVRLVVPAGWGPRRRTTLRQAAHRAGLGQPTLVEAPVAAVQRVVAGGTTIVVGSYVVVCDVGGGFEASVLRRVPTGFEVLSTIDAPDAGGCAVDAVLADELARLGGAIGGAQASTASAEVLSDSDLLVLMTSARTAKEALTHSAAVAAALPGPIPAVVVHAARLAELARPVLARAAATTRQAIDAAGVRLDELAAVYCVGGAATPVAVRVLAEETGLSPLLADEPQLAAALGAAQATATAGTSGVDHPTTAPPMSSPLSSPLSSVAPAPALPPVRRAFGLLVPGVASLALVVHFVVSADREGTRARGLADPYNYILANWGELAMAATFALITALVGATVIASVVPVPQPPLQPGLPGLPAASRPGSPSGPGQGSQHGSQYGSRQGSQQIGTGLLAAVAVGLAVAGLYAVGASVYFDMPTGGFLRWALLPILPVAAAVTVTAVLASRWGRIPAEGWHAWLNFPLSSVFAAAAGMLAVQVSMTAKAYPTHALANGLVGRIGALLLGVGAALALVRPLRFRLILAAPLAVFTAAIVSWQATGLLAVLYITAVTVWWLQQVWRLLRTPRRAAAEPPR
jgi:hypothetical protein